MFWAKGDAIAIQGIYSIEDIKNRVQACAVLFNVYPEQINIQVRGDFTHEYKVIYLQEWFLVKKLNRKFITLVDGRHIQITNRLIDIQLKVG